MQRVKLVWPYKANEVAVTGSFCNWSTHIPCVRAQLSSPAVDGLADGWMLSLDLPIGDHRYQFLVNDDHWAYDDAQPFAEDADGNRFNVISVTSTSSPSVQAPLITISPDVSLNIFDYFAASPLYSVATDDVAAQLMRDATVAIMTVGSFQVTLVGSYDYGLASFSSAVDLIVRSPRPITDAMKAAIRDAIATKFGEEYHLSRSDRIQRRVRASLGLFQATVCVILNPTHEELTTAFLRQLLLSHPVVRDAVRAFVAATLFGIKRISSTYSAAVLAVCALVRVGVLPPCRMDQAVPTPTVTDDAPTLFGRMCQAVLGAMEHMAATLSPTQSITLPHDTGIQLDPRLDSFKVTDGLGMAAPFRSRGELIHFLTTGRVLDERADRSIHAGSVVRYTKEIHQAALDGQPPAWTNLIDSRALASVGLDAEHHGRARAARLAAALPALQALLPGVRLTLHGSVSTGFASEGSDLDVMATLPSGPFISIRSVFAALQQAGVPAKFVDRARIPIIECSLGDVTAQVTEAHLHADRSSARLRAMLATRPDLFPVLCVVRHVMAFTPRRIPPWIASATLIRMWELGMCPRPGRHVETARKVLAKIISSPELLFGIPMTWRSKVVSVHDLSYGDERPVASPWKPADLTLLRQYLRFTLAQE
ncbi:hypothetical protein J8273_5790 [Carpediemonas membranifera]|uniref:AMP-activated protein kinase glycogen-binding domain-containing protein n=1 Tax=Carpediemonas membranifera TaxID=201153 RepID=A0A8J6E398_9EUKA|nr:hypothetical protein J8273_5790 [Carpediemonas membranifera]|eukprot:KAG9392857.1 hypothetical protein J8273_5790 [Carpediemonas membranifera]